MPPMRNLIVAAFLFVGGSALAEPVEDIWKAKCKSCHGPDGAAQTTEGKKQKVDSMRPAEWQTKWTDEKIKKIINDGSKDKPKMKAFKGKISDEDIDALVKHIRTFADK